MKFFASRSWYEVQTQVPSVYPGHRFTYRAAFNGSLRQCRRYVEGPDVAGIGYRVVRTKVVMERGGSTGVDELRRLFRTQTLHEAAQMLDELAHDGPE